MSFYVLSNLVVRKLSEFMVSQTGDKLRVCPVTETTSRVSFCENSKETIDTALSTLGIMHH